MPSGALMVNFAEIERLKAISFDMAAHRLASGPEAIGNYAGSALRFMPQLLPRWPKRVSRQSARGRAAHGWPGARECVADNAG
jgi:hypothetical protein